MSNPANDRRAKAAAARSAAVGSDKRRERIIRIVGAATVVIVVIAIIAISIVAKNASKVPDVTPTANPSAALPSTSFPSSSPYAYGVPWGTGTSKVPVLEIWEDFQCPSCEALEKANGAGIRELAAAGKVQLIWRMTTFLDNNLKADLTANGTTASSARATAAWGCAIDQGKTEQYHGAVYANPPATEGKGFTNDQLVSFAKDSGIEGAALDTFTACMDAGTYLPWSANSTVAFASSGAQGTPYAKLNGVEVPNATLADKAQLDAAVAAATK
ncbi:MAG: thioredoxin domain-containing protein [Candidatus Nanopelagicales bacterium]|nr:thioredoxin domain-containing protein [Candidatus Nanopelagicales bacterium]